MCISAFCIYLFAGYVTCAWIIDMFYGVMCRIAVCRVGRAGELLFRRTVVSLVRGEGC